MPDLQRNIREELPKLLPKIKLAAETLLADKEFTDATDRGRLGQLLEFCKQDEMTIALDPALLPTMATQIAGLTVTAKTLELTLLLKEITAITAPDVFFIKLNWLESMAVSATNLKAAAIKAHQILAATLLPSFLNFKGEELRAIYEATNTKLTEMMPAIKASLTEAMDPKQENDLAKLKALREEVHQMRVGLVTPRDALNKEIDLYLKYTQEKVYKAPFSASSISILLGELAHQRNLMQSDPGVNSDPLYVALEVMKKYGEELLAKDKDKGQVAITLAERLTLKATSYYKLSPKEQTEKNYLTFKKEFTELLHSKDKIMSKHRAAWKPILANIALALLTCTLAHLARGIYSLAAEKKFTCVFFTKTERQKKQAEVETVLEKQKNPGARVATL